MTFDQPHLLLLLLLLPPCALYARRQINRTIPFAPTATTTPNRPTARRQTIRLTLFTLAAALALVALAGPRYGTASPIQTHAARNLVLLIDVSRSMLARDARPNRLASAKAALEDLLPNLSGERLAIIAFRSKPALLCPLTTDAAFLRETLAAIVPEAAPPGETDLARALHEALAVLNPHPDDASAILLVTDGEDLTPQASQAIALAKKRQIPISVAAVGTPEGAPIPGEGGQPLRYQGQEVRTRLNEPLLRGIAEASGGDYLPPAGGGVSPAGLSALARRTLGGLASRRAEELASRSLPPRQGVFLLVSAVLFGLLGLLSSGRSAGAERK